MGGTRRATIRSMVHMALHLTVPLFVALAFYRRYWRQAALILLATMVVDLDHLLADPVYDPTRCSIGSHPLHAVPAIVLYAVLCVLPVLLRRRADNPGLRPVAGTVHLIGLGLLLHMALDWSDCLT